MSSSPILNRRLLLNGFEVELPAEVAVVVRSMPNPADVKAERERLAGHWFVHWFGGNLFCLRLKPGGPNLAGVPRNVKVHEHPWLFRARLDDVIASVFDRYAALRYRPFTFLAQRDELIATAAKKARLRHSLLTDFKILPKFSLSAKIIEPRDGDIGLGLFVTLGMRHEINAELEALQDAGVDLFGLYVIRRNASVGQRQLVGRVERLEEEIVYLSEATDATTARAADVHLESSLENFSHCLNTLLGNRYTSLRDAIDDAEAAFRTGPAFDDIIEKMGEYLRRKSPVEIGQQVQARVGRRLSLENDRDMTTVYTMPPIEYVFDRAGSKRHTFAWPGLQNHGPYDRTTFAKRSPRILVVYPDTAEGKVETFLKALRDGMPPPGRQFPSGFAKVFGLLNPEFTRCPVRLFGNGEQSIEAAYRRAAEAYLAKEPAIDAAIVAIVDEHAHLPMLQNPYARSKAFFLTLGIPTQQIRLATVNQRPVVLQHSLQNLSIALYAKLNGTPWTVDQDQAISDEIVIGMGIAEMSGSRTLARQRFVGITTVFGGDGTYLLGNFSRECSYDEYGDLLRDLMVGALREVRARNNWQPGDTVRVIFHAHKPLKRDEVAKIVFECAKEVGDGQNLQLAFVTVSHDHPFFLADHAEKGVPVSWQSDVMKARSHPRAALLRGSVDGRGSLQSTHIG